HQNHQNQQNHQATFLLKGITGSGKTEVYLEVIKNVLKNKKRVLFLVPEITLIGPMAQQLKSKFDDIAIYHSALSKGERYDQYQHILKKTSNIILGTRSAVFLPIEDLGLIIVDEEHDKSYIQQEGVIYDARDVAKKRSAYHRIPLILGSATPSIETMYASEMKQIQRLELTKRPLEVAMPTITYVDMKNELMQKNTSIFSRTLLEKMRDRLAKKEQIMLLFNRKGYAPFVLCRQCGDVPTCPHCSISLTFYKDQNKLRCHYCGHEEVFSKTCSSCQNETVKEVGVGIEYVEQSLKRNLPEAKVLRMDANATRTKQSHEIIWNDFRNEEADILLGTQMIAKGLDFPKVTLVGVLMADLSLRVPSYRASEETFMLLTQVTGRSGRMQPGEAVIQGYDLDHYAIQGVQKGYDVFYEEALQYRKLAKYAPFYQVSQVLFEGTGYLKTYQVAFNLRKALTISGVEVLGPTPALIRKIKDHHRFTITLKYQQLDTKMLFDAMKSLENENIKIKYLPNFDTM
ncbi:MAG: primosomal protein N', partial [Acholeplasmataceae bacterium]|nr:primosomal protein N' [Acholeplasmataceae bacterium]